MPGPTCGYFIAVGGGGNLEIYPKSLLRIQLEGSLDFPPPLQCKQLGPLLFWKSMCLAGWDHPRPGLLTEIGWPREQHPHGGLLHAHCVLGGLVPAVPSLEQHQHEAVFCAA